MKRLLSKIALMLSVLLLVVFLGSVARVARSANLEVASPDDSGPGTLRQVLLDATAGDIITFSPSVFPPGSPRPIFVRSPLPTLDESNVTIDASNAGVIIDGSQCTACTCGLTIEADNCVIQGLTIQRFPTDGICIEMGAEGNTIGGDRGVGAGPNGQGNLIIFNGTSGISIRGDANLVRGNYIGIDGSGQWDSGNGFDGVALWEGATGNIIGGTESKYRNVISGNDHQGVWIFGPDTRQNEVIGNYIGTRADGIGPVNNGFSGVAIQGGAQENRVGGTTDGAGNLISGNSQPGVSIHGSNTMSNTVQGNDIGTNADGNARLANVEAGIRIDGSAHDNRIEGNVLSGNGSGGHGNGIVIVGEAHHNVVAGNYIGTDKTGSFAIDGQPGGGVDLAGGAHHNTIGGPTAAGCNIISGNGVDGIFIEGPETRSNTIQGNYIGTNLSGTTAIPNNPWGLFILNGASDNLITGNLISHNIGHGLEITGTAMGNEIVSNTISHNGGVGIHIDEDAWLHQVMSNTITGNSQAGVLIKDDCIRNRLSGNSIYNNGGQGIQLEDTANGSITPPQITSVDIWPTGVVTGTTVPNARVEFFSDDEDEGRVYEGFTTADGLGNFSFSKVGGFIGPNVTATATDGDGNTSEFSQPAHLLWILYLPVIMHNSPG